MEYPIYYWDLEQQSEEWFAVRQAVMTASNAQAIAAQGKGLETYIRQMMSEKYSSGEKERFSNKHTDRGNELEPQARAIYSFNTGLEVKTVGFIKGSDHSGCSPDSLVGDDGGLEIKCPDDARYFNYLLDGIKAIDTGYIWQVQMSLLITGRKWWDFMAYNPNFQELGTSFTHRFYPDVVMMNKIKVGLQMGEGMIKLINKKLTK